MTQGFVRAKLRPLPALFLGMGLLAAQFLVGPPSAIDFPHHYSQWIGVLCFFGVWLASVGLWGDAISRKLEDPTQESVAEVLFRCLLWGTAFSAYAMSLANLSGIVFPGLWSSLWARALLLIGFFGGAAVLSLMANRSRVGLRGPVGRFGVGRPLSQAEFWALLALGFAFVTRFVFAARLHRHGDALLYHLLGPRVLFDRGDFQGFIENPILFQISHWESLTQWANLLFVSRPGTGLAWVQIFAQWIHTTLGWGGTGLGLFVLLRRVRVPFLGTLAIVAGALSVAQLEWTAHLAKTDWGVVFWCTGLIWLWTQKRFAEGGFLAGLVFSAKITSTFVLFGLVGAALLVGVFPRRPREIAACVAWGLVACAPIWIRNAALSGNPFFPTLNEFFQSPLLAETLKQGVNKHSFFHIQSDAATWNARLQELLIQTRVSGVLLLGPIVGAWALIRRKNVGLFRARFLMATLAFTWGTWMLFTAKVGADAEMRWLGPALPLALAANFGLVILFLQDNLALEKFKRKIPGVSTLGVFAIVIASNPPSFVWFQWGPDRFPLPEQAVMGMRNGAAKKWLREHVAKDHGAEIDANSGAVTLATQDNEMYYVSQNRNWVSYFNPSADRILRTHSSPIGAASQDETMRETKATILDLRKAGVRYYLFDESTQPTRAAGPGSWDGRFAAWVAQHPSALRFGTLTHPLVIDFHSTF